MRSQRGPTISRTTTVMATEAMMVQPIWGLVRSRSWRTTAINGAMPNHPKKQRKNESHVRWKVRI